MGFTGGNWATEGRFRARREGKGTLATEGLEEPGHRADKPV